MGIFTTSGRDTTTQSASPNNPQKKENIPSPKRRRFAPSGSSSRRASQAPTTTASAGKIGRTYGASFEWDFEKNKKMKTAHVTRNHASALSFRLVQPPRTASRNAGHRKPIHGTRPSSTIQTK